MLAPRLDNIDHEKIESVRQGFFDEIIGKKYVTRQDSIDAGKALRKMFPRSQQGHWEVKKNRTDAIDLIADQEKERIQELIPVRHERMAASAFAFYRAGAAVMAYDLSTQPWTGIMVQACGDAHISNFGMFLKSL